MRDRRRRGSSSRTTSRDDKAPFLDSQERDKILELAEKLKSLDFPPTDLLRYAVAAEEMVKARLPVHDGFWDVENLDVLMEILRSPASFVRDPLYSPSVLREIASQRNLRAEVGAKAERSFPNGPILDRLANAIALKTETGRPPDPRRDQQQDRVDYGTYWRIQGVLASELGRKPPKRGKVASLALVEIAWTRKEFEPHLSRQVAAYRESAKRNRLSVSERASLVLLGILRDRRGQKHPISDSDVDEAHREISRLENSLRRLSRRLAR